MAEILKLMSSLTLSHPLNEYIAVYFAPKMLGLLFATYSNILGLLSYSSKWPDQLEQVDVVSVLEKSRSHEQKQAAMIQLLSELISCRKHKEIQYNKMIRQVQVEPAKSSKSKCKNCRRMIEKGELRAKMVDDRAFRDYARRHPGSREGEGYSRGYFQTERGCISIEKYYVHLRCYRAIYPHPKEAQYFKLVGAKAEDREAFRQWIEQEQEAPARQEPVSKSKPKSKKKRASDE